MRTFFCALFMAFFTLSVTATPTLPPLDWNFKTKVVKDKVIKLTLTNLNQETTRVFLTDLREETEFFVKRVRNHNGYSKALDLRELPNGRYLLKVQNKSGMQQQIVLIRDNMMITSDVLK